MEIFAKDKQECMRALNTFMWIPGTLYFVGVKKLFMIFPFFILFAVGVYGCCVCANGITLVCVNKKLERRKESKIYIHCGVAFEIQKNKFPFIQILNPLCQIWW